MKFKKYSYIAAGLVFLIIAAIGISQDKPDWYVVCLVLGFSFFFQGVHKILQGK